MPKKLQKSLQDYLSKIKHPHTPPKWVLSSCKHRLKTLSFAIERDTNDHHQHNNNDENSNKKTSATLSDVDRFLFENFRSLYLNDDESNKNKNNDHSYENINQTDYVLKSPRFVHTPPGLRATSRFFVSPGLSNSLVKESPICLTRSSNNGASSSSCTFDSSTSSTDENQRPVNLPDNCIAILKHSPNPYDDFRESMEEMIEAKMQESGEEVNWEFMEELLFCYLKLNEKKTYKYILSAFADLVVVFRQDDDRVPIRSRRVVQGDFRGRRNMVMR